MICSAHSLQRTCGDMQCFTSPALIAFLIDSLTNCNDKLTINDDYDYNALPLLLLRCYLLPATAAVTAIVDSCQFNSWTPFNSWD